MNPRNFVESAPDIVSRMVRHRKNRFVKIDRKPLSRLVRGGVWALAMLMMVGVAAGCSSELDPTEPEGAYYLFRDALLEGDAQAVWERSDPTTHLYFEDRYAHLVEMDETIDEFLPQTDHRIAREQSGAVLLDEVKDGKGLFAKIFQPHEIAGDEAIRIGSDIDELEINKDRTVAKVLTRAEQTYLLSKDSESGQWHIMLMDSATAESVEKSLGWLGHNQSALQQTVEDLVDEQREKREAIIAELMKIKAE